MSKRKPGMEKNHINFKFGISNFKSFKQLEYIDIKPLTVLCGVNNCGKSSLIQSILLFSQSLALDAIPFFIRRLIVMEDAEYATALMFEGELCHLSDYDNIINKYIENKEFSMSFILEDLEFSITFFNPLEENRLVSYVKDVSIKGENFDIDLNSNLDEQNKLKNYNVFIKRLNFNDFIRHCPELYMPRGRKRSSTKEFENVFIENYEIKGVNIFFNGFVPQRILLRFDRFFKEIELIFDKFAKDIKETENLKEILKEELQHYVEKINSYKSMWEERKRMPNLDILEFPEGYQIETILRNCKYIGPLRDEPHRYYQFFDIRQINIGNKGEYAPQILTLEGDSKIPNFKIYDAKDSMISFIDYEEDDLTLEKGLKKWSEVLNFPVISPKKVEQILFKMMVPLNKDINVTLQDVGFGISQILPVFIESLRMELGSILILEQPEIHLHPNMQSKLADFLLSMALSGKNFIIETHSEHLINRLCLRIAQDQSNKIKDLISINFIEPPKGDGKIGSEIKNIKLNQYGEIEKWPVGFLDDSDDNKIIEAAINKRKNES